MCEAYLVLLTESAVVAAVSPSVCVCLSRSRASLPLTPACLSATSLETYEKMLLPYIIDYFTLANYYCEIDPSSSARNMLWLIC